MIVKQFSIFAFLILGIGTTSLLSQNKHDYTWLQGVRNSGMEIKFSDSSFMLFTKNISTDAGRSVVMSDTAGNFQFYCDGCNVFDQNYTLMEGGDSLNSSGLVFSNCSNNVGYPSHQGMVALPWPGRPDQYAIFHLFKGETAYRATHLFYSVVDMSKNGGIGKVISKNMPLVEADLAEDLTAVRHGNGRDWWVVCGDRYSDRYTTFLLSPAGISGPFFQYVGNQAKYREWYAQAAFSPDGTLYAKITGDFDQAVLLMNFDRCSGLFSCTRTIEIPYTVNQVGGGLAFSPNSRYLYVSTSNFLYQADLHVDAPAFLQIDEWDGYVIVFSSRFFRMQLAPDHKIYMCSVNGIRTMHIIEQPDSAGTGCHFRQHYIPTPYAVSIGLNNFPVYRLYDQPRSLCDTLGIDVPPGIRPAPDWTPPVGMSIQPSPAHASVYLAIDACLGGRLRIFDARGRLVYEENDLNGPTGRLIPVEHWGAGMYVAQLFFDHYGPKQVVKKFWVAH